MKIVDDAVQNCTTSTENRQVEPSESSCILQQSAMEHEGRGADEIQMKASFVLSLVEKNEKL